MTDDDIQEIKDLLSDESDKWRLDIGDWMGYVEELLEEIERLRVHVDDFDLWWRDIGSGIVLKPNEDQEDHAKRVALAAWSRQINEK